MLYAQLAGATSLREIETAMQSHSARLYHLGARKVSRSTLADANATRPHEVFPALFSPMAGLAGRGFRRSTEEATRLIDATGVKLAGAGSEWARFTTGVLAFSRLLRVNIMHRRELNQLLKPSPKNPKDTKQLSLDWGAA